MVARIPVFEVRPQVEHGRFAAKAVQGEEFEVWARIVAESHLFAQAEVVLTGPDGTERSSVTMHHVDNDHWSAKVRLDEVGPWTFAIRTWHDPLAAWVRDAQIKLAADADVETHFAMGARVINQARDLDPAALSVALDLVDADLSEIDRLAIAIAFGENLPQQGMRFFTATSDPIAVHVDRDRALFGSWYEFFPRSEGAYRRSDGAVVSGTFLTAAQRLEAIAQMGFDVVYLPPIHPIGVTKRKGPNNSLQAGPDDPGSPWAIGSSDGGHDAINPELGTVEDFEVFVGRSRALGLEIALDLALQCSPDHPWLREHPEWFIQRPDGTIATAENPPKVYEDIHPLDFDADPEGLLAEVERIVRLWMSRGVRIFRVDNPHTKPVWFWERLLASIRRSDPDVVFLAEAFTAPAMLHALAMIGFHQSYTYFTWREHAQEIIDYLDEVAYRTSHFMRPNFFVNTPDILPRYLQGAGQEMFRMRAALAATGSPTWGMYAGFELGENTPAGPDTEEYLDSEKYEICIRDWSSPDSIAGWISRLNEIRRAHPALQRLRNLSLHVVPTSGVIAYSRREGDDVVLVVINLHPSEPKSVFVALDSGAVGVGTDEQVSWRDEIDGSTVSLRSVALTPQNPARILTIVRGSGRPR